MSIQTLHGHIATGIDLIVLFGLNGRDYSHSGAQLKRDLKEPFKKLRTEIHPDKYSRFPKAIQRIATELFTELTIVYEILNNSSPYEIEQYISRLNNMDRDRKIEHPILKKIKFLEETVNGLEDLMVDQQKMQDDKDAAIKELRQAEQDRDKATQDVRWKLQQYEAEKLELCQIVEELRKDNSNGGSVRIVEKLVQPSDDELRAIVAQHPDRYIDPGYLEEKVQAAVKAQDRTKRSPYIGTKKPTMILTGGNAAAQRSLKRAKYLVENGGANEVLVVYDETWHTSEPSYRFRRVTVQNCTKINLEILKKDRRVGKSLAHILRLLHPGELHIQSRNYGELQARQILRSGIPTVYFFDHPAGPQFGHKIGEEAGIRAASTIKLLKPEYDAHLKANYASLLGSKKVIGK